jgi:hypothetical protein
VGERPWLRRSKKENKVTTPRRKATVALLLASLVVLLLPQPAWAPRTFALISIAGPCSTPDGLRGSFTGSAVIQSFDSKGDIVTALADLSGTCTDGTTFVPMRPMTTSLEVHIQSSSCDTLDLTFGPVDTGAFVADLTNSHTHFEATTKQLRSSLCAVARTLAADKDIDQLVRSLNRLIKVTGPDEAT